MKRSPLIPLLISSIIYCTPTSAKTMFAICSDLSGQTTRYLSHLNFQDKDSKLNQFQNVPDKMSNTTLVIVYDEVSRDTGIALSNSENLKNLDWVKFVNVIDDRDSRSTQLTFAGIIKGAPVMVSVYPNDNVAIYAQHSTYPDSFGQGVRAYNLHSKCIIDWEKS